MRENAVDVLRAFMVWSGTTDSYCEVCDKHAPKDIHGNIEGPVPHDPECVYGIAETIVREVQP